jgi:hypothetical protein
MLGPFHFLIGWGASNADIQNRFRALIRMQDGQLAYTYKVTQRSGECLSGLFTLAFNALYLIRQLDGESVEGPFYSTQRSWLRGSVHDFS